MTEMWAAIAGHEDCYEVSSLGRVRSIDRKVWSTRDNGHWVTIRGRDLTPHTRESGHVTYRLAEQERQARFLVLETFGGEPKGFLAPDHLDGDPLNNDLSNLRWGDPLDQILKRADEAPNGCWVYQRTGRNGYAAVGIGYQTVYAHRYVYERMRHEIPDGLVIDHLCRNRACVNPDHLEPVPQRINILRGLNGGKRKASSCKRGHEYTPENSYINPKGYRSCRTCIRARQERATS